jgi:pilus assembly protein CpaE
MPKLIGVIVDVAEAGVRQAFLAVMDRVEGFEVLGPEAGRADLLVKQAGPDFAMSLREIKVVRELAPEAFIFVTAASADPAFLIEAVRLGVRDFFVWPPDEDKIAEALGAVKARFASETSGLPEKAGSLICVTGVKGGLGATTVAVNLAAALQGHLGERPVVLLDMNMPYGETQLFLDLKPKYHWGELIKNISRVDAVYLMDVLSRHPSGLYVMPCPSQFEDLQMTTPEAIGAVVDLLRTLFAAVVVDMGVYFDDVTVRIISESEAVLAVCEQSLSSMTALRRLYANLDQAGDSLRAKVRLVVNRHIEGVGLDLDDIAEVAGGKPDAVLPMDAKAALSAINEGKTLADIAPKSLLTKAVKELAMELVPGEAEERKKTGLLGFSFGKRK